MTSPNQYFGTESLMIFLGSQHSISYISHCCKGHMHPACSFGTGLLVEDARSLPCADPGMCPFDITGLNCGCNCMLKPVHFPNSHCTSGWYLRVYFPTCVRHYYIKWFKVNIALLSKSESANSWRGLKNYTQAFDLTSIWTHAEWMIL